MAVKIRLKRMGSKRKPFYRVVVADSRFPRDGRFIESVGYYNPLTEPVDLKLDEDEIFAWLQKGAQPSDTVRTCFLARASCRSITKHASPRSKPRGYRSAHSGDRDAISYAPRSNSNYAA